MKSFSKLVAAMGVMFDGCLMAVISLSLLAAPVFLFRDSFSITTAEAILIELNLLLWIGLLIYLLRRFTKGRLFPRVFSGISRFFKMVKNEYDRVVTKVATKTNSWLLEPIDRTVLGLTGLPNEILDEHNTLEPGVDYIEGFRRAESYYKSASMFYFWVFGGVPSTISILLSLLILTSTESGWISLLVCVVPLVLGLFASWIVVDPINRRQERFAGYLRGSHTTSVTRLNEEREIVLKQLDSLQSQRNTLESQLATVQEDFEKYLMVLRGLSGDDYAALARSFLRMTDESNKNMMKDLLRKLEIERKGSERRGLIMNIVLSLVFTLVGLALGRLVGP